MNEHAADATGLGTADASNDPDYPEGNWRYAITSASLALSDALRVLEYSSRQEVQAARQCILEAVGHIEEACAAREG